MATDLEAVREKATVSESGNYNQQRGNQKSHELDHKALEQETNHNIVDFDGPEDPANPRNWPTWKRMIQVVIASAFLLTA